MKQYYYINASGAQAGPISPEQFAYYGVTANTKVWCDGMPDWTPAGNVPELRQLFAPQPPQYGQQQPYGQPGGYYQPQCPSNYLVWSILSTLLCCLPLGIVAIIYSTKVDSAWNAGNFGEAQKASSQAKTFNTISLVCGIIACAFYFMIAVLAE